MTGQFTGFGDTKLYICGFFCYDAETESYEVFTFKYSNHHPLIHQLLLGNCLRLGYRLFGNYNAGVTLYVIFQMIVMSAVFFAGILFQSISLMSLKLMHLMSLTPHHDRLSLISFAEDFSPEPKHCVMMTARLPNISFAGLCGIHLYPK